ncbi:MAG: hypothetical protein CM15mP127_12250 [Gammaproteobacteria bacterium]|nr:MAG: hypothetical protein CM15mP127_12250 [Gammaproteobacteria bacterium]
MLIMAQANGTWWRLLLGKDTCSSIFCGVPFGFTADEINAWVNREEDLRYGRVYIYLLILADAPE